MYMRHLAFSPIRRFLSPLQLTVFLAAMAATWLSAAVHAMGVQPMVFELEPIGSKSRSVISITNDSNEPISVEAIPHRMSLDQSGHETREPADDDLLIFPPVAIIPAGETQAVQVQYVGDPEIAQSVSYRVSVMQVAVKLEGQSAQSGMAVTSNFHTLLNVSPAGSSANLQVEAIDATDTAGKWRMTISNSGNRFARLSRTRWTLQSNGKTVDLAPNDVAQRAEGNLVLPESSLDILFNAPDGLDPTNTTIAIKTR